MTTPESCAWAFKEWASVCAALETGRQTILLRKGGIRESAGAGAFAPEHPEFWLYPTLIHQTEATELTGTPPAERIAQHPSSAGRSIPIRALVRADKVGFIDDEHALSALGEFHTLSPETVLKRFHYRTRGLWVVQARVWLRETTASIAETPGYLGCKTWVNLREPLPTSGLTPAIALSDWAERTARLNSILSFHGE